MKINFPNYRAKFASFSWMKAKYVFYGAFISISLFRNKITQNSENFLLNNTFVN